MLLIATAIAAGCGGDDSGDDDNGSSKDSGSSTVSTPAPLEEGGEFVVCTDVPYPPAEFLEGDEYVGYEIDLMNEIAERLNTTATYEKTLFDAIIPALQSKKCDAIISSMNVTPEREEEVSFVPYMEVGQSLMVTTGEGEGIETLDDLAGRSVAVQVGTTLKTALDDKSKELEGAGEDPIDVQTFPDAGAAAAALKTDRVDVFFGDSPVVADYVVKDEESFEFAGEPIDPLPVGIALRKEDTELQEAIQTALDDMYEDGTVEDLLSRWNVEDFMLSDEAGDEAADEGADDPEA
jgi:polar amino acid transport system substrate-binding protein